MAKLSRLTVHFYLKSSISIIIGLVGCCQVSTLSGGACLKPKHRIISNPAHLTKKEDVEVYRGSIFVCFFKFGQEVLLKSQVSKKVVPETGFPCCF